MTAGEQLAHEAQQLGPYRLRGHLGEGGMGVVHLGIDPSGRAVAVKVLRAHIAHDPDARARLAREVSTLRRVRHPLVAEVLDADVDGERPYVVTRFVPGSGLDAVVRDAGRLDADRLVRVGRGLSSALGAIHAAGVVHRDLKPANVLMLDGDPVVIDFGIAHVADDVRLTSVGLVMGTPGYLSPEVVDGDSVTPATDWWGWAATLAFAASGRPPFGRGPMDVVIDRVRRGQCDLSGVDERQQPLLAAALAVEPARRPHALEVLHALERYAMGEEATVTMVVPGRDRTRATGPPTVVATVAATRPAPTPAPLPAPFPAPVSATVPSARVAPSSQGRPSPVQPVLTQRSPVRPGSPPPPVPPSSAPPGGPQGAHTAAPVRPSRRTGTVLALLAAFVGAAAAWPVATAAVALGLMVIARTVERGTTVLARRRYERGPRRSDGVVVALSAPWHLARSVLVGAFAALLPALLGVAALFCTGLVVTRADGTPAPWSMPAVAAGTLVALVASWCGPGGGSLRRGTRTIVRAVAPPSEQVVVVLLLVLVAGGCALYALQQGHPSWWPVTAQQLPAVLRLP